MKRYHQLVGMGRQSAETPRIATIDSIEDGTARLVFAHGAVSQKRYRLSPAVSFAAGQKVRLEKLCGTYVVTGRV